ncbi:sucrase/ferredoxin-like domain-containing protein [Aspergillus lucknowensis]|uniref:Sucrase/ferredoxin-like-domain-containing protein n=1 Tax=Aspergillus lucknowensis TaxID=176173 RepID=A0ABR4LQ58_9EURO
MQSFIRRGASYFSPSPSPSPASASNPKPAVLRSEGFSKAPTPDTLFPKTDPSEDGEECLHDCATCTIKYPAKFDVDQEDQLYGHVNGWSTHLLVATGKTDWVRDVADEQGSVMEAIDRGGVLPGNGKLKLSASNMLVPDEYHAHEKGEQPTTVLLLPSFTIIDHVTPALVPDLIREFVDPAVTNTTPLGMAPAPVEREDKDAGVAAGEKMITPLRSRPCPHAAVILLCSQKTRDARCGQSAPLLRREFDRHLRPLGLHRDLGDERPGGVGIYFISHVGGHKYAANVIVYRRRDFDWYKTTEAQVGGGNTRSPAADEGAAQCIWLARVRPEDCENIVRYTVLQGKVVKPGTQLRGGFDRERGLISW